MADSYLFPLDKGPKTHGRIREETCPSHKHVEWTVRYLYGDANRPRLRSPVFTVDGRAYYLRLFTASLLDEVELSVVRAHAPQADNAQFWSAIRQRDGSYDIREVVTKKREAGSGRKPSWTQETSISVTHLYRLVREKLKSDGQMTVFFRVAEDRPQAPIKVCARDVAEFTPSTYGSLLKERCPGHMYVEWKVSHRRHRLAPRRSEAFRFGRQVYVLELSFKDSTVDAALYRIGPERGYSARWCAGLKLSDGSRGRRTVSGSINLRKTCEFWKRMTICKDIRFSVLERQHLSEDGFLTFFFRISKRRRRPSARGTDTCSHFFHDLSLLSVGSVAEEERPSHRRLEWDVRYDRGRREWMSPAFLVHEQRCLFVLSVRDADSLRLRLFRTGGASGRLLRWWAGVHVGRSDYRHYTECGELALVSEDVWTPKSLIYFNMPKKDTPIRVCFLFSAKPGGPQAAQESEDDVVFKVEDEEFAISRSVLNIRIPVLEAMLLHDNLENRTGLVHIEDCEPDVFRVFLNFVYMGDPREVVVDNCFDLYVIADKYLFDPLKSECLERVRDNLTRRTFFDTISLAFRYENQDLLKRVSFFLLQDQNFLHTKEWLSYCIDNPRAKDLLPNLMRMLAARKQRRAAAFQYL